MKSSTHGFTFIEVVIALAIVSISLLAMLKLHLVSIRLAHTAQITSNAVFLAQEKLAESLALGYPQEGANCGTVEENAVCFRWQTEVTPLQLPQLATVGVSGLREISVDVSWEQGSGQKRIRMFTYVADRKLQ
jgi:general secretion pathway protein I